MDIVEHNWKQVCPQGYQCSDCGLTVYEEKGYYGKVRGQHVFCPVNTIRANESPEHPQNIMKRLREIEELKDKLTLKLMDIRNRCSHSWGKTVPKSDKLWERTCSICGVVSTTTLLRPTPYFED